MLQAKRSWNVLGLNRRPRGSRRVASAVAAPITALEARLMMHAGHDHGGVPLPPDVGIVPGIDAADTTTTTPTTTTASASSPLTSVPALDSRPGATAKLYLDFDGDTTSTWGSYRPGTTPAYDQDGDATTFSDGELASIREIFDRVSEKFSPFNVNVTTVDPGTLVDRVSAKVVFGGNGAWLGANAGGVAYVGGFSNGASNTVFVFPKNLSNGYAQYSAEAAAHEAGHGFNLQHQAQWNGTTLVAEYAPANAAGDAPIMGNSYTARRGLWWKGTSSVSSTATQDDLSVLASSTNGFGYRADDFGSTIAAASTLTLSGSTASAKGVVEQTGDLDVFSFTSGPGTVSFSADPVKGGMLDATLSLRDGAGNVLASAKTASLGESLSANIATQGTYYITVGSNGAYGDMGQYTLSGSVQPAAAPLAGPTEASATAASATAVDVRWADNAGDEAGFLVQRSADGGATWTDVATVGANVTSLRDAGVTGGTAYAYRVRAFDATRVSAWSNNAAVTTPAQQTIPAAPGGLVARQLSNSAIRLTWTDNSGNETGFRVYGSRDNGSTWSLLGTVGANVTSADHTGLKRNQTWTYRVSAYNAVGESAATGTATARTSLSPATAATGDANLDGLVNFDDLLVLSSNYNTTGRQWEQGDFTGDGRVNFDDLLALSTNYNKPQAEVFDAGSEWGTLTAVSADTAAVASLAADPKAKSNPAQVKAKLQALAAKRPASLFSVRPVATGRVAWR